MIATSKPIVASTKYMSAMDAVGGTRANFISEIKRSVTPAMMEKCATHIWTWHEFYYFNILSARAINKSKLGHCPNFTEYMKMFESCPSWRSKEGH
jgi:hypothetical protein